MLFEFSQFLLLSTTRNCTQATVMIQVVFSSSYWQKNLCTGNIFRVPTKNILVKPKILKYAIMYCMCMIQGGIFYFYNKEFESLSPTWNHNSQPLSEISFDAACCWLATTFRAEFVRTDWTWNIVKWYIPEISWFCLFNVKYWESEVSLKKFTLQ